MSRDSILSTKNKLMGNNISQANSKAPTDIFLKVWNSEAGKVFRKDSIINKESDNPHRLDHDIGNAFPWIDTTPHLTLNPVSPFCSSFNSDQGIINKETNSATGSHDPSSEALMRGQIEIENPSSHEYSSRSDGDVYNHDIQDLTDLLLDYPNDNTVNKTSDNNSNITELNTNSELQSAWGWQELSLDEDNDYWNSVLGVHDQTSSGQN
ncbi:hypothetical protein SUGI_0225450 [Cryptomeria japonica]|nr:hypothetical protein SUGI_0225450 [Cryptomeria japonica]